MEEPSERFARALGEALRTFLDERGISVTEAANRVGMNKQTLSTYWTDNAKGKRPIAGSDVLFAVCGELGFEFEYEGYKIAARSTKGLRKELAKMEQLRLPFSREFELVDQRGIVTVSVKRPPGRVEFSVSLKAVS